MASSEESTLADFASVESSDTPDATDEPETRPQWVADVGPQCECGARVGKAVARLYGDEHDTVPVCSSCTDTTGSRRTTNDARVLGLYYNDGRDSLVARGGEQ